MDAKSFLSEADRESIRSAIEEAEQRTSAELVCAVATESDRYDRAESMAGLALGVVGLCAVWTWGSSRVGGGGSWESAGAVGLGWYVGAVVIGFLVGSITASYWHGLRRMLVSPSHLRNAVERAGWRIFGMHKLGSTEDRAGILLYVSLFERKLAILADESAREALDEEAIDQLRDTAVEHMREGRGRETFVDTIDRAADALEVSLPADDSDRDELRDLVLQFHPRAP